MIHFSSIQSNGATYRGHVEQSYGGVGRNIADCLSRLDVNTLFISAVGQDSHTAGYRTYCKHMVNNQLCRYKHKDHSFMKYLLKLSYPQDSVVPSVCQSVLASNTLWPCECDRDLTVLWIFIKRGRPVIHDERMNCTWSLKSKVKVQVHMHAKLPVALVNWNTVQCSS